MFFARGVAGVAFLAGTYFLVFSAQATAQSSGQFIEMNCVPVGAPPPTAPAFGPSQYGAGVEVINGSTRQVKSFNAQPVMPSAQSRADRAKADPGGSGVEVINGETHRTVFWNARGGLAATNESGVQNRTSKRGNGKNGASASGSIAQIEIMNGTEHQTLLFDALPNPFDGSDEAIRSAKPVVLGVITAGARNWNGAVEPVVIGISPSGSQPEQENVQPVADAAPAAPEAAPSSVAPSESVNRESGAQQPAVVGGASGGTTNAEGDSHPVATNPAPRHSKRPPYRKHTPKP